MDAITKSRMDKLHTGVVGNPALRLPGGMRMPSLLGIIPGMEAFTSWMMKSEMDKLDIPPVSEFFDLITAGGGKIYACKTAADMFKLKMEDLCEHVTSIITVGEFYELAGGEGSQIIFT
jgi:peroxiredoxin family protein